MHFALFQQLTSSSISCFFVNAYEKKDFHLVQPTSTDAA